MPKQPPPAQFLKYGCPFFFFSMARDVWCDRECRAAMEMEFRVDTAPPRARALTTVVLTRPPELPPEEQGHGEDRATNVVWTGWT